MLCPTDQLPEHQPHRGAGRLRVARAVGAVPERMNFLEPHLARVLPEPPHSDPRV